MEKWLPESKVVGGKSWGQYFVADRSTLFSNVHFQLAYIIPWYADAVFYRIYYHLVIDRVHPDIPWGTTCIKIQHHEHLGLNSIEACCVKGILFGEVSRDGTNDW